jgi:NAD+ kinase
MVVSADEPVELTLLEGSGRPAVEVDGVVSHRTAAGETIHARLHPGAGLVVRLDRDRHQRRNQVKLSLLDLPFLPEELRDLGREQALEEPAVALKRDPQILG